VIGVSLDTWMLHRTRRLNWAATGAGRVRPFAREEVTLEDVADHIEHICELAGSTLHAAIGGDTDGQGGLAGAPGGIDTVADYPKIAETLERRNWKTEDIANVMHANWQRFFEEWLPN
jgi:membrane dipeptidase